VEAKIKARHDTRGGIGNKLHTRLDLLARTTVLLKRDDRSDFSFGGSPFIGGPRRSPPSQLRRGFPLGQLIPSLTLIDRRLLVPPGDGHDLPGWSMAVFQA
jgi:hypothetical protein